MPRGGIGLGSEGVRHARRCLEPDRGFVAPALLCATQCRLASRRQGAGNSGDRDGEDGLPNPRWHGRGSTEKTFTGQKLFLRVVLPTNFAYSGNGGSTLRFLTGSTGPIHASIFKQPKGRRSCDMLREVLAVSGERNEVSEVYGSNCRLAPQSSATTNSGPRRSSSACFP